MASHKLSNYVRMYRRRIGLSQDEVGFLLGKKSSAHISRYEHFCRVPNLESALALSVVLQVAPRELFAGEYRKIAEEVCEQAERLEGLLNFREDITFVALDPAKSSTLTDRQRGQVKDGTQIVTERVERALGLTSAEQQ